MNKTFSSPDSINCERRERLTLNRTVSKVDAFRRVTIPSAKADPTKLHHHGFGIMMQLSNRDSDD